MFKLQHIQTLGNIRITIISSQIWLACRFIKVPSIFSHNETNHDIEIVIQVTKALHGLEHQGLSEWEPVINLRNSNQKFWHLNWTIPVYWQLFLKKKRVLWANLCKTKVIVHNLYLMWGRYFVISKIGLNLF